ncbi:MAG: transglycosylase SLT domain-containing protein [Albidovulum sp.]
MSLSAFAGPLRALARRLTTMALSVISIIAQPIQASASALADQSVICDQVASEAARQSGVPLQVLKAISLTETGRKRDGRFQPWPWTVNMEGKGLWFDTEDEARTYVYKEYKRGARSFDVGCFQINFKWHGEAFRSIEDMFDPLTNALYAAKFLRSLYVEQGDWGRAAGAYHSRNAKFATRYQERFERIRSALAGDETKEIPVIPDIVRVANGGADGQVQIAAVERINTYPLLQTGGATGLGSLVPLGSGGAVSLFGPRVTPTEVN